MANATVREDFTAPSRRHAARNEAPLSKPDRVATAAASIREAPSLGELFDLGVDTIVFRKTGRDAPWEARSDSDWLRVARCMSGGRVRRRRRRPADAESDDWIAQIDDFGHAVITGFTLDGPYPDRLDLGEFSAAFGVSVRPEQIAVRDDGDGNARLHFPAGETVTLLGIAPDELDPPRLVAMCRSARPGR
ncbi:hypothetical protein [Tropicimonas sp. IMCC6043]|uniref:hypothetical protein n=1 Tax=Tropicimonas sp. IMCC6043 TaxID=2510645 RepID=UPI00101C1DCB|nr:hypothetical protein [Tropicimonas sp. IMCC6043]RYH10592.1 hypothetical protein EU800_07550 [Tropicimonas sp. IMCC6043]